MAKIVTLLARKGTALFRTFLLVIVIGIIAAAVVYADSDEQDRAVKKAIEQYISVASSQFDEGLYSAAKGSLDSLRSEYGDKLTDKQDSVVEQLLGKTDEAIDMRKSASLKLSEGVKALESGDLSAAQSLFEEVRSNKYASDAQKEEAAERLKASKDALAEKKDHFEEVFKESYELYKDGDLEAAEAGFKKVKDSGFDISRWFGRDSDYYLEEIQKAKKQQADSQKQREKELEAEKAAQEAQAKDDQERKAAEEKKQAAQEASRLRKQEMQELFDKSYELYKQGNLEEAKEGFAKVDASGVDIAYFLGRDSQHFIKKIDKKLEEQKLAAKKAEEKAAAEAEKARKAEEAKALAEAQELRKQQQAKIEAARKAEAEAKAEKEAKARAEAEAKAEQAAKAESQKKALEDTQAAEQQKAAEEAKTQEAAEQVEETMELSDEVEADSESSDSKEKSYIRVVQEKRARQRDYTKTIVSDSVEKANQEVEKGNYSAAKGALAVAYSNIDKTKMLLGDELYNKYKNQLDQLSSKIEAEQEKAAAQESKVKRKETAELQENIRSNVEKQRQEAVKDYLANAMAFQREQRYEEALAQLEALLAIDPLNSIALLQKQTIEETITWREQLSVQREQHRQEIETLLNSDRASIPYSDEVTYPKNWKDIVEKRKSQQDNDFTPEDKAVYQALEQTVDLTDFYEDMTFGEAIEILSQATDPPITIVVLWTDLDQNAFVDRNTPINLTIPAPVKAKLGLNLLLSSVAGGLADISYVVTDGVIRVATVQSLPDKLVVRKYDVTELLSPSAEFNFDMDTTDYGNQEGGRSAGGGGGSTSSSRSSSQDDDEDYDSDTMREEAQSRASAIIQLIQETIDPEGWYEAGGDASLTTYSNNVLVIRQTLENHEKIRKLLDELRSSLGEQVAIEARFLTVTENFLEEIGLDLDVLVSPDSDKWNDIILNQQHMDGSKTKSTGVPGSLPGAMASTISGGYVLDDLQVSFILEATQAHKDSKTLNAPKVTVLSGESAGIRVETEFSYVADYEFEDITASGDNQPTRTIADPEIGVIRDGVILNVTPTITADKKYVLLRIMTSYTKTDFENYEIPSDSEADQGRMYEIQLPISEIADVRTRVTVPDSGTLLIGGQKLTGEMNTEEGVPVLSKMPILGRLFENRGKVKDNSILLILVKPTIILQDEQERDAVAAMESQFD